MDIPNHKGRNGSSPFGNRGLSAEVLESKRHGVLKAHPPIRMGRNPSSMDFGFMVTASSKWNAIVSGCGVLDIAFGF